MALCSEILGKVPLRGEPPRKRRLRQLRLELAENPTLLALRGMLLNCAFGVPASAERSSVCGRNVNGQVV
jgi:hypothetical protein